jgi:hypothetical protein
LPGSRLQEQGRDFIGGDRQQFQWDLVRQMQIDHRGGDLLVTQELLDGVQMRPGFEQMGGEAMAKGMD